MTKCHALNKTLPDAIVNVANFMAPGPVNVVPDKASASVNIRISRPESVGQVQASLQQ